MVAIASSLREAFLEFARAGEGLPEPPAPYLGHSMIRVFVTGYMVALKKNNLQEELRRETRAVLEVLSMSPMAPIPKEWQWW